ncbi:hypothetical protein C7974DRAFT_476223 [Boeremia exigua]|uniref:uncharacterized protein n=1 Tax=Boeremia exigua TaxID=749465 RepID=UPI001E8D0665|nr:uncharacterized protein C7974DRAFT_476223 [Boeremia exigua]KAH6613156.1 hypothetical protein C7974DRAFT_476223 [Boeremia exigua]
MSITLRCRHRHSLPRRYLHGKLCGEFRIDCSDNVLMQLKKRENYLWLVCQGQGETAWLAGSADKPVEAEDDVFKPDTRFANKFPIHSQIDWGLVVVRSAPTVLGSSGEESVRTSVEEMNGQDKAMPSTDIRLQQLESPPVSDLKASGEWSRLQSSSWHDNCKLSVAESGSSDIACKSVSFTAASASTFQDAPAHLIVVSCSQEPATAVFSFTPARARRCAERRSSMRLLSQCVIAVQRRVVSRFVCA